MRGLIIAIAISITNIAQSQASELNNNIIDSIANVELREIENNAFRTGEYLKYKIHYGFVDAGEAELRIANSTSEINGREVFHMIGTGRSLGAFDWFFKVRDKYETYMDTEGMYSRKFKRHVNEGGYKINQEYTFNQEKQVVTTDKLKTYKTPEHVQDMLSAYYYARTIDFSNAKKGDIFTIPSFVDGETFPLKIKYIGKESISLRNGKFRCMKFVPVIQEGRIFKDEEDLNVWITDDENKIPILIKADILFGSIKMEVTEYSGLKNPIAKINSKN